MDEPKPLTKVKSTGRNLLFVVTLFLMLFPFINTMNQFLVNVVEPFIFFKKLQDVIIPYQVSIVRGVLSLLSVRMQPGDPNSYSITIMTADRGDIPVWVEWNCLGWQSLLVILATLVTGLTGHYTLSSKLEVLVVGLLSTFVVNITRLVVIFLLYYSLGQRAAVIFHDFGSVALTVIWMIAFWYYATNFILEEETKEAVPI